MIDVNSLTKIPSYLRSLPLLYRDTTRRSFSSEKSLSLSLVQLRIFPSRSKGDEEIRSVHRVHGRSFCDGNLVFVLLIRSLPRLQDAAISQGDCSFP